MAFSEHGHFCIPLVSFFSPHAYMSYINMSHFPWGYKLKVQHTHTNLDRSATLLKCHWGFLGNKWGRRKRSMIVFSFPQWRGKAQKWRGRVMAGMIWRLLFPRGSCVIWIIHIQNIQMLLDRITVCLSNAICCSNISLFLFLLNTLVWNWKWSDYIKTFFPPSRIIFHVKKKNGLKIFQPPLFSYLLYFCTVYIEV